MTAIIKSRTPILNGQKRSNRDHIIVARNRSHLIRNRSWVLLDGRNKEVAINGGIAKKLAIASGDLFPANPREGQLFIKGNQLYRYEKEE